MEFYVTSLLIHHKTPNSYYLSLLVQLDRSLLNLLSEKLAQGVIESAQNLKHYTGTQTWRDKWHLHYR